jgi:ribonuclease HI
MVKMINITCDGSTLGNGSENSISSSAALIEEGGDYRCVAELLPTGSTNNQAEIVAACIALESLPSPSVVTLFSDSQYVIRTMLGEFKKGKNPEFWRRLDNASSPHKITWTWIKGHAGHQVQEAVNDIAQSITELGYVSQSAIDFEINKLNASN